MKLAIAILTVLGAASPALASSLAETIVCQPVGAKNLLKIEISTYNRPDFDLGHFDSQNEDNYAGVVVHVTNAGKPVQAKLVTYTSIDGKSTPIMDRDSHGKACALGSDIKGIQVAAKLTVGHVEKLVILSCNDRLEAPHGGDCQ